MAQMMDLGGKVVLITGSTRGIGRAIAEAMARAGAKIVVSSRNADRCDEVVSELLNEGHDAFPAPCNVGKKEDLERLVSAARRHFGSIDCLVCNAAANPYYGPLSQITDEVISKMLETNLWSKIWLCNLVLPQMAERGGGSVIVVSSVTGLGGSSTLGMYAMTKASDMQLTRNLAVEWGPRNIRANCLAPGLVRTEFARALWENAELRARVEARTPLGRIGEPADIGGAAVFLASPAAGWITGQTLVIDGGAGIAGI
jgi:NAD(P)-dependent dehydrogenase (short-subunit alcohol dehydrogenase family)